jgi:hypothetical protein
MHLPSLHLREITFGRMATAGGNVNVSSNKVKIVVHYGKLTVQTIKLGSGKEIKLKKIMTIAENTPSEFTIN